jgi:hypothetical protein
MGATVVLPVPPLVDVTVTKLAFMPAMVAVTLTETEQVPRAETVASVRLIMSPLIISTKPMQVVLGVVATKPPGRLSVNATPVSDVPPLGFVIVKVREVLLLRRRDATPNCSLIVGGATTLMVALALPVPPVDVTVTELFLEPALVVVTLRENEQLPRATTVPPDRLTVPLPAVAVAVPPQDELRPLGVETTKPDGRLSVNPTSNSGATLEFVIVTVREVKPPTGMDETPNALVIDGGDAMAGPAYPATISVAASHIISAARFPAKRGMKQASNIKRLEICISPSCGIGGDRGCSEH